MISSTKSIENPFLECHLTLRLAQAFALFLIIVGVRFAIVFKYGSDLPFWDQWDAEGEGLIKNYFEGKLDFKQLFAPHNEHRIFFTRIIALASTLINSQWDARVEMLINAVICSVGASGLYYYVSAGLKNIVQRWFWFIAVAIIFTFPFGWENSVAGFQSQFYLLTIFSITAIALLSYYPSFSWQWLVGAVVMLLAPFTMASGLFVPIVVILVLIIEIIRERNNWRNTLKKNISTYLLCTVMAIVGLLLTVKVDAHLQYQAHSLSHFFEALLLCFSWPYLGHNWWAIINWFPFAVFLIVFVAGFKKSHSLDSIVLGTGLWVILQSAAIAFSRADTVYSSRYFDVFSYALIVNFICILLLFNSSRFLWKFALILSCSLLWLVVNGTELYNLSFNGALYNRKSVYDIELANTGAYIATGDFDFLIPKNNKKEIPFPDGKLLAKWLNDSAISAVLPASVRRSIVLTPATAELSMGLNPLGILESPLHPGQPTWFAFASQREKTFAAVAKKDSALPYLKFFVNGDIDKIVVKDSDNLPHSLNHLPLGGYIGKLGAWQPVYVYSPGKEFKISGEVTGAKPLSFSAPTEMGRLSLWGVFIASAGVKIFWVGVVFSFITLILEVWILRRRVKVLIA